MEFSEIEQETRRVFPDKADGLVFSLIQKGGSGRVFVRVSHPSSAWSVVAMHYQDDRPDNRRFAAITDFLNREGIASPRILARREELNLLWVEDKGEADLGTYADTPWKEGRRQVYEQALDLIFQLHQISEQDSPAHLPGLEPPFDESLYEWEQHYFLEHYVGRFVAAAEADRLRGHPGLKELRAELAGLPRFLVHRDFQSTNVMLQGDRAWLIDYQGMRWGRPEYDLASLIYDPYMTFTDAEREDLVDYYYGLKQNAGHGESREVFQRTLHRCALQRLMQAVGAYGFLSQVKGKPEFLAYIEPACHTLTYLMSQGEGWEEVIDTIRPARIRPVETVSAG